MQPAAQPGTDDACLQDTKCSELYESGRVLSQAGQYEAALVAYQSAYARKSVPWLLVNIGRMQQKAGRLQQAILSFKRLLAEPAAQSDDELQTKTHEYLRQAEQDVELQQRGPIQAQLMMSATKPDARKPAPVYKKWWFWTALGGATAAVAVGLAVGLTSRSPTSPSVPQGVSVYETGF